MNANYSTVISQCFSITFFCENSEKSIIQSETTIKTIYIILNVNAGHTY